MKNMLTELNGGQFALRFVKATLVILIGFALATSLWMAGTPGAEAQSMTPQRMIEAELAEGQTVQNARKADLLSAVCAAVKKFRPSAPLIVRLAVEAHPDWKKDILRSAFSCLGTEDCRLLARVLRGAIAGAPGGANELTELAIDLAPSCAGGFGGGTPDDDDLPGGFGSVPLNQNPPPGSVGGGGGQGNVVAVCINDETRFFTPEGAEDALRNNSGATLGACQVTPESNR